MSAEQIEARAAELLMRREEPDWSPADQRELEAWLSESLAHRAAYWRLEHGWAQADRLRSLSVPPGEMASPRNRARRYFSLALVATITLAVLTTLFWPRPEPAHLARFDTQIGQRREEKLPDGSVIALNTDTHVRVALGSETRAAWIDEGEAYFQIAHDPARPFVIHAGSRDLQVLGTRFSVRRDADLLRVAVVDGAVQLQPTRQNAMLGTTILRRGSVATANGTAMLVSMEPVDRLERQLLWRNGVLDLDGNTLGQAIDEFNRYTNHRIVLADRKLADTPIGGSVQLEDEEAFVRLLAQVYGLHTSLASDGKIILRKP